jgi:hypothetical protein
MDERELSQLSTEAAASRTIYGSLRDRLLREYVGHNGQPPSKRVWCEEIGEFVPQSAILRMASLLARRAERAAKRAPRRTRAQGRRRRIDGH